MSRIKRTLVATATAGIVGAALAVAPATPAMAIPLCPYDHQCNYTWYTDIDHDTVAGMWTMYCDGTQYTSGTRTPHLSFASIPCN